MLKKGRYFIVKTTKISLRGAGDSPSKKWDALR
jgi:hypothetical protein